MMQSETGSGPQLVFLQEQKPADPDRARRRPDTGKPLRCVRSRTGDLGRTSQPHPLYRPAV